MPNPDELALRKALLLVRARLEREELCQQWQATQAAWAAPAGQGRGVWLSALGWGLRWALPRLLKGQPGSTTTMGTSSLLRLWPVLVGGARVLPLLLARPLVKRALLAGGAAGLAVWLLQRWRTVHAQENGPQE
jgi:hypothetical protein